MSIFPLKGIAAAILVAGLGLGTISVAWAQPAAQPAAGAIPAAKADSPTDNALRRNPGSSGIAVRTPDRAYCREQAAKMKLFGLGRHKFLQRCRKARRKALQHQPGPSR